MNLDKKWKLLLEDELNKSYFTKLMNFLEEEQNTQTIYPSVDNIFAAFNLSSLDDIKVVILGQDPYHGENQAHGLAFSVEGKVQIPPSLRNIFKEYHSDLGLDIPISGNLTHWACEGVFLLNTVLSVREANAHSHKGKGWEVFTDFMIKFISDKRQNVVFILWGKPAQLKSKLVDESKHLVLKAPHPSPLSSYRGFFGSCPFTKVNAYLSEHGIKKIDWKLD